MVSLNQTRSGYLINASIAYPHLCTNMLRDVLNFRLKNSLKNEYSRIVTVTSNQMVWENWILQLLRLIIKSSNTEAGYLPSESADSNIDIFGLVFYCISYFICGLETQSFISFEMYYIAILTSKIFFVIQWIFKSSLFIMNPKRSSRG